MGLTITEKFIGLIRFWPQTRAFIIWMVLSGPANESHERRNRVQTRVFKKEHDHHNVCLVTTIEYDRQLLVVLRIFRYMSNLIFPYLLIEYNFCIKEPF